jgi:lysophospholipase L1-like esterase
MKEQFVQIKGMKIVTANRKDVPAKIIHSFRPDAFSSHRSHFSWEWARFVPMGLLIFAALSFLASCGGAAVSTREAQIAKAKSWYDQRISAFQRENDSLRSHPDSLWQKQIVLLGDSFTERFDQRRSFPGRAVLNRGITSDHIEWDASRGILHRLSPAVLAPNPSHIVLLAGVNDIGDDNSLSKTASLIGGYALILQELTERYPSAHIAVCSLLPAGGRYAKLNDAIRKFNIQLRELSKKTRTRFIDLYPLYADGLGRLKSSYTSDGLHIKPEAYSFWIDALHGFLDTRDEVPSGSR